MPRAALPLLLLLLAACGGGDDVRVGPGGELLEGGERATAVEERGVTLAGRTLVLDGFAGSVHIIAVAPGAPARLRFERVARGRTALAAQERLDDVTLTEAGDGDAYRYEMRSRRPAGSEVNVEAEVPANASLVVRLGSGDVRVDGVRGDVEVTLNAGSVRATGLAGGRVTLTTQAGSLDAEAAAVPAGARWRLETRTGTVALGLPPRAPLRVDARTGTGAVRVEGLAFTDERLERPGAGMRFAGQLGEGDGQADLRTEVGAVRLRAAAPAAAAPPVAAPPAAPPAGPAPPRAAPAAPRPVTPRAAPAPRPPAAPQAPPAPGGGGAGRQEP